MPRMKYGENGLQTGAENGVKIGQNRRKIDENWAGNGTKNVSNKAKMGRKGYKSGVKD